MDHVNRFRSLESKDGLTTLFNWHPKVSDSLSLSVHLLKLPHSKWAWIYLAKLFAQELKCNLDPKITVLVPIPGHKKTSTHTLYFSESLSDILHLQTCHWLSANFQVPEQKKLTRAQRLHREFNFYVDFTQSPKHPQIQNIILVDDIVTTGATIQACQKLLKPHFPSAQIQSWVLFKRL